MTGDEMIINQVEQFPAFKMIWPVNINAQKIADAFIELTALLDAADSITHIIVDLSTRPDIPVVSTYEEVVKGPLQHPMMGEWLVIGKNLQAEIISNMMNVFKDKGNIHWFKTEDEAMAYLETLTQ